MAQNLHSPEFGVPESEATTFTIRISPVIEREFDHRGVFPELRLANAHRIINGATGVYCVSIERAREVLADAEVQNRNRDLRRGLPVAYGALARNITDSLKQESRRGLVDDPGMAEAQRRQVAASACFSVGDNVLYFVGHRDEYGREATIVGEYQLYSVLDNTGPYISRDGLRRSYRPGYAIRIKGSDSASFAAAYQLTRHDCKPSQLRLIAG